MEGLRLLTARYHPRCGLLLFCRVRENSLGVKICSSGKYSVHGLRLLMNDNRTNCSAFVRRSRKADDQTKNTGRSRRPSEWPRSTYGAACNQARSLIHRHEKLFSGAYLRHYARGNGPLAYAQFLGDTVRNLGQEATKKAASPGGQRAQESSSGSPPSAKTGLLFTVRPVRFSGHHKGERSLLRILVIKDRRANRSGPICINATPRRTPRGESIGFRFY
jgi:hypothetical protein